MSNEDKAVRLDFETHLLLGEIQQKVYRQSGEKPSYKEVVSKALTHYDDDEAWKTEEVPVQQ